MVTLPEKTAVNKLHGLDSLSSKSLTSSKTKSPRVLSPKNPNNNRPRITYKMKREFINKKLTSPNLLFDIETAGMARQRDKEYFDSINARSTIK